MQKFNEWLSRSLFLTIAIIAPFFVLTSLFAVVINTPPPDYPWTRFIIEQRTRPIKGTLPYDNKVAWIDSEYSSELPILVKDLQTGEIRDLAGELPCEGYQNIDMDGDWLVADFYCDGPITTTYQVHAFNLTTNELVFVTPPSDAPVNQIIAAEPAIYGEKIVWYQITLDNDAADLYLYDLQTYTAISLTHNGGPVVEIHPDIYEDWIVWDSYNLAQFSHSVVAYHLTSGETITIPIANYPYHPFPNIDNNLIIWDDYRNGNNNGDIYGYDLNTRQEFPIITTPFLQWGSAFQGNILVYLQEKPGTTDNDIFAYDLDTGETAFIFHDDVDSSISDLEIQDGLITWQLNTVGLWTVYGARRMPQKAYMPIVAR